MKRVILVTGAGSGIGFALAKDLAGKGHRVYGAVRRQEDVDRLKKIDNVFPIALDVRDPAQIKEARGFVESHGTGLYGLVNNAGVGPLGYLHTFTPEELNEVFDTNVYGPLRMTNAFLDLLLVAKGRVVNIGSQGGTLSMAFYGPYTMTKHAIEAYTVALAAELGPQGVRVSIVQPGGIATEIGAKGMAGNISRFERAKPPFAETAQLVTKGLQEPGRFDPSLPESATNRNPSSPAIVTEAVLDALFSANPKLRYMVGTRWEGNRVINALLDKLLDANECPTMKYSRDDLMRLLDEKWQTRTTKS